MSLTKLHSEIIRYNDLNHVLIITTIIPYFSKDIETLNAIKQSELEV
jgi:hypothetical protein